MNILDIIKRFFEADASDELTVPDQEAGDFNYAAALSDLGFPTLF